MSHINKFLVIWNFNYVTKYYNVMICLSTMLTISYELHVITYVINGKAVPRLSQLL